MNPDSILTRYYSFKLSLFHFSATEKVLFKGSKQIQNLQNINYNLLSSLLEMDCRNDVGWFDKNENSTKKSIYVILFFSWLIHFIQEQLHFCSSGKLIYSPLIFILVRHWMAGQKCMEKTHEWLEQVNGVLPWRLHGLWY